MLELLLFRHAKSSWDAPGLDDHARDLAPRGEKAAPRMGRLIAKEGLVPDLVLCSTARRAMRTWELASAELKVPPPVKHLRTLYMAPSSRLLEIVGRQSPTVRRLMLVGHNPGLHDVARKLVGRGDATLRARLAEKLPTAALVRIGFVAESWTDVTFGTGELLGFRRPRELD